ncbi:stress response protein ElaB [Nissabacter sp. SGAir0207]|uniref:stress response protein ElaB n=1 Tax=Nissabacter sp. SGAir0207 TaxID=2126321 RepID=UPI0010CD2468|nr:stress response protein ElaB [Nissabacter sp. SGAir0207]QCR35508.1 protein ElaB [Nissabacter sp. SGAir0207]
MATTADPKQSELPEEPQTSLDDDLKMLSDTLEEVLSSSGDKADQKYIEIKHRAEEALHKVKKRLSAKSDAAYYKAKQAACSADSYVHEKPWHAVGMGAAAGMILGLLMRR